MNQLFGLQHRRKHHPPKALPQGRDATAPPVALSLRYARGIKAPAWIQRLRVASRLARYGSPDRAQALRAIPKL